MIAPGLETTGNNSGRSRIARALAAFDPTLPRLGRLMRQAKRCLIANDGSATTTQIRAWCYPGREREHWHHAEIRRALRKIAKPIGRSPTGIGRPGIWTLDTHTENPSPDVRRVPSNNFLNELRLPARRYLKMDLVIAFLVVFAVGFGAGYAVRERKSRMRRRRYYHADTAD